MGRGPVQAAPPLGDQLRETQDFRRGACNPTSHMGTENQKWTSSVTHGGKNCDTKSGHPRTVPLRG